MSEAKKYYKVTCSIPFSTCLYFYADKQDMEDDLLNRTHKYEYDEVVEELTMPKTKEELVELLTETAYFIQDPGALTDDYYLVRAKLAVKEDEKERKKRGSD